MGGTEAWKCTSSSNACSVVRTCCDRKQGRTGSAGTALAEGTAAAAATWLEAALSFRCCCCCCSTAAAMSLTFHVVFAVGAAACTAASATNQRPPTACVHATRASWARKQGSIEAGDGTDSVASIDCTSGEDGSTMAMAAELDADAVACRPSPPCCCCIIALRLCAASSAVVYCSGLPTCTSMCEGAAGETADMKWKVSGGGVVCCTKHRCKHREHQVRVSHQRVVEMAP